MANIKHHLIIAATAQQVHAAITTEEGLKAWWTNQTTAKPAIGFINHFRFGEQYFNKMKITKLAPKEILWKCVDGDQEWIGTFVSFILEEKDGKTILKFTHTNWATESDFFGHCNYHWGRYLESLKILCETGTGKPFTQ